MTWSTQHDVLRPSATRDATATPLDINQQCFIRKDHRCGKMFGASKSCFIACPTHDSLEPIIELMSEKLAKVGIEPVIAVKERAYGQDIFCTKICGRIIESRFCIVILDDTVDNGTNIPNPNVYYEYGLMTSLRKHIIPLQMEDLTLAFNIQSYDTIKYGSKNIASELDRAIKDAIRITEAREPEADRTHFGDRCTMRRLELAGLQVRDKNWFLWQAISDTNFRGFGQYDKKFYVYLAKIESAEEFQSHLDDLDVVLYRTEKKAKEVEEELDKARRSERDIEAKAKKENKKKAPVLSPYRDPFAERALEEARSTVREGTEWLHLMRKIYVGFIVDPHVPANEFKGKAEAIAAQYSRYELTFNQGDRIPFGDLAVSLAPSGS